MSQGRWQRVDELFHQALERDAAARQAFLAEACADDAALKGEVESLLAAHRSAGSFLEPDASAGAPPTLAPGRRLGRYEVVEFLAAGGMGEVHRARDAILGREVALKVVRPAGPGAAERLAREARAASALTHPNVLVVHDAGVEGDLLYVVTELLEGQTLRALLEPGAALAAGRALDYARQIAAGLAAAHEKGIVHRDLKPENLFVTREGRVKILDFGVAKLAPPAEAPAPPSSRTEPGVVLGTAGYMSPEQAGAGAVDARSDVFAFGAVLYEMLSGRRAFAGRSALEALHAVLAEEPPPLAQPGLPPALDALVRRCLAKDPGRRFPSGGELAAALEAAAEDGGGPVRAEPGRWKSVAVLPFRDLSGDPGGAALGLGLTDAVITELSRAQTLRVRSTSAILRYQGQAPDPREAARDLGVEVVVDGSIQRSGSRLRVTVRVVSAADDRCLCSRKIDAALDDVFRVEDEVSRDIARALEIELGDPGGGSRSPARPASGRAYEAFLGGKAHLLHEGLSEYVAAIDSFERSRDADPSFAPAWAGLADAYARIAFNFQPEGDWYPRAASAVERALALDPDLPEARYVRGRLLWAPQRGFDHAGAMREFFAAIAGRPSLEDAVVQLGTVLHHVGMLGEAEEQLERALAISPGNTRAIFMIAYCRHHQGRFEEALALSESVARQAPSSWVRYQVAACQLRLGRLDDALETAERMGDEVPGEALGHSIRGLACAQRGDVAGALEQVRLFEARRAAFGHRHHGQYDAACIHALCGRVEDAVAWLERAARGGYPCRPFFEADPLLASLRSDGGYRRLMDGLRAECGGYARLYRDLQAGARERLR
jgi:TolB-like protein/Flp pilus assembly protein TadD